MLLSLIIKIFSRANLLLGLLLRKRKKIDPKEIKSVLVNRSDRLGDAIVSLPFLLELGKRFEVTVLTSEYNDVILKEFLRTEVFLKSPPSFWDSIRRMLGAPFRFLRLKKTGAASQYDLYLDLVGARGQDTFSKVKEKNLCRYYAGFNLGAGNLSLDYAASQNPALFSPANLVDSCRRLLRESLQLDLDVPDYIDLTSKIEAPSDFNPSPPYILVNIAGYNKFRGPSAKTYARIVNEIDFPGTFVIMDDRQCPDIPAFKKFVEKENLHYLEGEYTLWRLLSIAHSSSLYIGSDSGISQFLGQVTHCVVFFATGEHRVWRPYSRNPYTKRIVDDLVVEETRNSANYFKKIIYAPVWCRPCFDFGCRGYRCIKRLDAGILAREISLVLGEITKAKQ